MTADTREELHEFAAQLGLRRSWFQDPCVNGKMKPQAGSRHSANWHYDVTDTKRREAVRRGAVEVDSRGLTEAITRRWMALGPCLCGCPDEAHDSGRGTHNGGSPTCRCARGVESYAAVWAGAEDTP